jgi:hypothetical protein
MEFRAPSGETSASPRQRIFTETVPPSGVNFKELLTRLMITWMILCWSPQRLLKWVSYRYKEIEYTADDLGRRGEWSICD